MAMPTTINSGYAAGRLAVDSDVGEKVNLAISVDFSTPQEYEFDLTTTNEQFVFGIVKSLFIDNSDNPTELVVSVSLTNQRFTVPSYAEGYFTIIANRGSKINISGDGGATNKINLVFHNWYVAPVVWYKSGNNPNADAQKVMGTNTDAADLDVVSDTNPVLMAGVNRSDNVQHTLSVNATGEVIIDDSTPINVAVDTNGAVTDRSIAMTGASLQIMAANANRRFLYVRNDAATDAAINFVGAAVIGGLGSVTLKPNQFIQLDSMFVPVGAINAIGTALANLTAYEG